MCEIDNFFDSVIYNLESNGYNCQNYIHFDDCRIVYIYGRFYVGRFTYSYIDRQLLFVDGKLNYHVLSFESFDMSMFIKLLSKW